MKTKHGTIIVGSGPAGLFCAIKLVQNGYRDILILESGKKYTFEEPNRCITSLYGGCSTNSDGKLTFHHQVGTTELPNIVGLKEYYDYMEEVEQLYLDFKPTKEQREIITKKENQEEVTIDKYIPKDSAKAFRAKALAANLDLLTYSIRHLGSDAGFFIAQNIHDFLTSQGVTILTEHKVDEIKCINDEYHINVNQKQFVCDNLVIGIGRSGANDFMKFMSQLDVPIKDGVVDCGLRIEVSNEICDSLLDHGVYEPKFISRDNSFEDRVRSFCWNRAGEVVAEKYPHADFVVANGHSLAYKKTNNTNFALLVTKRVPHPLRYLESICRQVNILSDNQLMIQKFGDLLNGRRSTQQRINEGGTIPTCDAYPGDLSLAIPYRILLAVIEMLQSMDKVLPGIASQYTLMYGIESKFYTNDIDIDKYAQTNKSNLYVVGDCSSKSRGQVASSTMGLMAAKGILKSLK